jgi:hypothetical protein
LPGVEASGICRDILHAMIGWDAPRPGSERIE